MDDLTFTQAPSTSSTQKPLASFPKISFPTPRSLPVSTQKPSNPITPPLSSVSKTSTPDSFANLLNFGRNSQNNTSNLSLQEQQKRLQEQKAKEAEEKQKQLDAQFGEPNAHFWDSLGSSRDVSGVGDRRSLSFTVPKVASGPQIATNNQEEDDEDLFAAFSAQAPVDRTSHFPPPVSGVASATVTPRFGTPNPLLSVQPTALDVDDPFDFMGFPQQRPTVSPKPITTITDQDDDDFLGLLGKSVSELPLVEQEKQHTSPQVDPRDAAIAELMDMGFSLKQARKALAETHTGLDVQQAVGWLLNEAHQRSREASLASTSVSLGGGSRNVLEPGQGNRDSEDRKPTWASGRSGSEKDITKIASEVGNNLFKGANSLWTQGKKKMERAIQELQQEIKEGGEDTPRWMKNAQTHQHEAGNRIPLDTSNIQKDTGTISNSWNGRKSSPPQVSEQPLTDEALMLEAVNGPPMRKRPVDRPVPRNRLNPHPEPPPRSQSTSPLPPVARQSPTGLLRQRQLDFAEEIRRKETELRAREAAVARERRTILGSKVVEEEPVAYISPARRRKGAIPPPTPTPVPVLSGENLLTRDETSKYLSQRQTSSSPTAAQPKQASPTPMVRKRPTAYRAAVSISSSDLSKSTQSRQRGSEAFRLGDYSSALTHYSSALSPLPTGHTLRVLLLCNRAICNLKVGDARACLVDCEDALALIGDGRGEGELIVLGEGEEKNMSVFWEKAWSRKAEGLEALEKWVEAGKAWTILVEAGKGGPNALKGRVRCEKAISPNPFTYQRAPLPQSTPVTRQPPPRATLQHSQQSQEAVNKLRQANDAAEAVEREKLALYDSVTERINAWKKGKEGNLRALLCSLDQILWEGSGWKKVGMHELVVPGKVKIQYMKGIARVHPDKVCDTKISWVVG